MALVTAGVIGKPKPVVVQAAQEVLPDPVPFRENAAEVARSDRGDSRERAEPGKRKPGRPARHSGHSD